ncbi:hypothetical protein ScFU53_09670 [Streptococcus canis]|nr:hypothetical protein ScFU1_14360 [Streptococcus canis]GFE46908.1 hypothetical protein ScFU129_05390 [Streptococcus canis]GFG43955.1 hypothetical protein ScFU53_09670 [Streptococcus canis]GFG45095.1 hypothetical protein ScFU93_03410 [Streptococcus canis]
MLRSLVIQPFTETFGGHNTLEQLEESFKEDDNLEKVSQKIEDSESLVCFYV